MNRTCFNDCQAPVVTTFQGAPVCEECFEHYMGYDKETKAHEREYIMSDESTDLRGF